MRRRAVTQRESPLQETLPNTWVPVCWLVSVCLTRDLCVIVGAVRGWAGRVVVAVVVLGVGGVVAALAHDRSVFGLAVGLLVVGAAVSYRAKKLRRSEERDGVVHFWR